MVDAGEPAPSSVVVGAVGSPWIPIERFGGRDQSRRARSHSVSDPRRIPSGHGAFKGLR